MKLDTIYKFKSQLGESTFFKGKLGLFKNNDYITILKDPSYNELQGLMNKSSKNELRGLITYSEYGNEEYYFWDASLLNHYGFYQKFGFGDDDGDINFILTKDSILFPQWMMYPKDFGIKDKDKLYNIQCDMEMVTNDYVIKKLYPNGFKIGVGY